MDMDKIKERVKALLEKAADSACSEAEATACMKKAQKLMAEHSLDVDDVKNHDSRVFVTQTEQGRKTKYGPAFHPVDRLMGGAVGRFCGVRKYWERDPKTGDLTIRYFGREPDVEYAKWMRDAFAAQADREWEAFKLARRSQIARDLIGQRRGFYTAFCKAVAARLDEWTFNDSDMHALMCKKMELVSAELDRRGIFLSSGNMPHFPGDRAAAAFGAQAGARANIGRAVNPGARNLIGGPQ